MKVLKQLLWFIVPTVLVWIFVILYLLFCNEFSNSNSPSFSGYANYLRLFLNNSVFPKALLNTLFISFIPAVLVSAITYISKLIFKFSPVFMYVTAFVFSTLVALFSHTIFFGEPININLFSIATAIQIGIICCFICWIINIIKTKAHNRISK